MEKKNDFEGFKKGFAEGFKYPWGKPSRLWLALWLLLPIFGWLALGGYGKKIVRSIVHGDVKELPEFGRFWDNFKQGVFILVFMLPTFIALMALNWLPVIGQLLYAVAVLFFVPWLTINFFMRETFDSLWELKKAYAVVINNFAGYLFALLKTLLFTIVYGILCFVIIGIPPLIFGHQFFIAEFYRHHR